MIEETRHPIEERLAASEQDLGDLAKLAAARAHFQSWALSQVDDAIIAVDNDDHITYWNQGAERLYGFQSHEVIGWALQEITHYGWVGPDDSQNASTSLAATGSWHGENIHFKRTGQKIYVESSVSLLKDEQKSRVGTIAFIRDISERKQAEIRSATFAALARKLSGARVPRDAAQIIADTAQQLFGWDSCTIDLCDAEQDLVRPILHIDTVNGERVDVSSYGAGCKPTARSRWAIQHGPSLTLRDDPSSFDEDSVPFGDKSRPSAAIMDVPICHASTVIGILSIQSYTPRQVSSNGVRERIE